MTQTNIIDLLIIACSGLLVWSIAATLTIWSERKGNGKDNEVTREQIGAQLRELVWVDFEEGYYQAKTGLPIDAYIQEYGGKYLAIARRTSFPGDEIERITPTIDDAKKELKEWQVEQVYRLFKHN